MDFLSSSCTQNRPVGSSRNVGRPTKKMFARFARITLPSLTHYFDISMHALIAINVATETYCGLAVMM